MFIRVFNPLVKYAWGAIPSHATKTLPCWTCGQQIRTTFILKRKWPVGLHKEGTPPRLRGRHFVYELVEDTTLRKHEKVDILLTTYVEGLGNRGEVVSVKPTFSYNNLLLPGLGVYPTPENIEKYTLDAQPESKHSSPYAERTVKFLSRLILSVVMNKEMPWTLEPWHISMSFRKAGLSVPEQAITMPRYPIKGPDLSLQNKEFLVKVTINSLETAFVRCRIHHHGTTQASRLPHVQQYWRQPAEPLFPEDAEIIQSLPPLPPPKKPVSDAYP
ncbi:large ribosomal subunit protein bL9m [Hetaerina americana]|uniref:large ribosomal subunit protein bL9m n=1 Tax=Hetaerina americana TaxID=62018 RepID=UPI003A7F172D